MRTGDGSTVRDKEVSLVSIETIITARDILVSTQRDTPDSVRDILSIFKRDRVLIMETGRGDRRTDTTHAAMTREKEEKDLVRARERGKEEKDLELMDTSPEKAAQ